MRPICVLINTVSILIMVIMMVLTAIFVTLTPEASAAIMSLDCLEGQGDIVIRLCLALPLPIAFILGRVTAKIAKKVKKPQKEDFYS